MANELEEENSVNLAPELIELAIANNIKAIQFCLDNGADINVQDKHGNTALMFAINKGHTELAHLLIDKGADVNIVSRDRWSPLMLACRGGHTELAHLLIDKGADVNIVNYENRTALSEAIKSGQEKLIHFLIGHGAYTKNVNLDGVILDDSAQKLFNQLENAIKKEKIEDIKKLYNTMRFSPKEKAILIHENKDGDTLLHLMIKTKNIEVIKASNVYERGFFEGLKIRNKDGLRPLEALDKLPENHVQFKRLVKQQLTANFRQGYMLDKMIEYIELQHKLNPDEYKKEDIEPIINSLERGHCHGFATLWGESMLKGKEQIFIDTFKPVVDWDGKTLDVKTKKAFESAISVARFTHVAGLQLEEKIWAGKKHINKYFHLPNHNELYNLEQNDFHMTMDQEKTRVEDLVKDVRVQQKDYKQYIGELCKSSNGKMVSISGNRHNIAIFCKDGEVKVYDSNYNTASSDGLTSVSKTIKIDKNSDYEKVADEIKDRLYYNLHKDSDRVIRLDLALIGRNGDKKTKIIPQKQSKETLRNLAIMGGSLLGGVVAGSALVLATVGTMGLAPVIIAGVVFSASAMTSAYSMRFNGEECLGAIKNIVKRRKIKREYQKHQKQLVTLEKEEFVLDKNSVKKQFLNDTKIDKNIKVDLFKEAADIGKNVQINIAASKRSRVAPKLPAKIKIGVHRQQKQDRSR